MRRRRLTVKGKTDGFGCQLNAKLSGIAFCFDNSRYEYVHTPFTTVSHGWGSKENCERINDFLGIPYQHNPRINVCHRYMKQVYDNPNKFYTDELLYYLRDMFWSNKKYEALEQITIHIRRGDIQPHRHDGGRHRRYQPNEWYSKIIPKVARRHPDSYPIVIHSEGDVEQFHSIKDKCPSSISERIIFKLGKESNPGGCEHNMLSAFYEMVASKVFVQSKSGLSYTAGIFNEHSVYMPLGNTAMGQKKKLWNWNEINGDIAWGDHA